MIGISWIVLRRKALVIRGPKSKMKLAVTLMTGLLVASCASFQPVETQHNNVQQQLQIGDTVRVVTKDGRKRIVKVSDLTTKALYGRGPNTFDDGKILFNDINSLEKKQIRKYANSPLVVYGAIGLGLLILQDANKDGDLMFNNN